MTWNIDNLINNIDYSNPSIYINYLVDFLVKFGPKLIWSLIVLWIWFKIINLINKAVDKVMDKANWDPMLESFLSSLISITLKILVFIIAAWVLWVQTTSLIAILTAAWFAVGMALSWTLQNFAWGVMILILKPFKLWDYVELSWKGWSITEIWIFNTTLTTPDKKRIIIPNSDISNWTIINYSSEAKRRVDLQVWIWYWDDIKLTKETLENIAKSEKRIIYDDWVTIAIAELWDNAVIFNFRFFVKSEDYWPVRWDILEEIKITFDKKWISFPFPQRDVHIYNEK